MSKNGWKLWKPSTKGGRYVAYENRMVVIIPDGKFRYIYLAGPVLKALGNPEYIEIHTRGSNIGLFKGDEPGDAYKIIREHMSFSCISAQALLKKWNIEPGVYDAHIEDDHIVFDTQQKPSKI